MFALDSIIRKAVQTAITILVPGQSSLLSVYTDKQGSCVPGRSVRLGRFVSGWLRRFLRALADFPKSHFWVAALLFFCCDNTMTKAPCRRKGLSGLSAPEQPTTTTTTAMVGKQARGQAWWLKQKAGSSPLKSQAWSRTGNLKWLRSLNSHSLLPAATPPHLLSLPN